MTFGMDGRTQGTTTVNNNESRNSNTGVIDVNYLVHVLPLMLLACACDSFGNGS